MNDIDVDQPVRVTPELARAIARTLSGSYPDTTAEMVTRELARADGGGRGVIGLFAGDSIQGALEAGVLARDSELARWSRFGLARWGQEHLVGSSTGDPRAQETKIAIGPAAKVQGTTIISLDARRRWEA